MFTTIADLANKLANKEASSVELTCEYLKQIKSLEPKINSFITVTEDEALKQAQLADKAISEGQGSALTGIPMAHKDIFCTKNIKTTCASRMLDNFVAPYDSFVAEQFNKAGMVCLGKTNMDEFAMGASNENSYYGPCRNPWNLQRVPGGSSGGSAAAVAAGLVPAATGTDTGGSIRQPAAFCGLTGIKPTYGAVSRYGMIAFASSLDQGGPMAHTAQDCALLLNVMAGFDERDSTSLHRSYPDFTHKLDKPLAGKKIGVVEEFFTDGLDAEVATSVKTAIKQLEDLGAEVVNVSLPHNKYAVSAYYVIAPAECSSNLARYDGVRFGHRCQDPVNLNDMYKRSRGEGFGTEVKRRILAGTYVLSAGYYDAYYRKAQQVRQLISDEFNQVFTEVDAIVGPTTPTVAFGLGAKTEDPMQMYLDDLYTVSANLAGLPALSMPCGFANDLPVGLQLIGPHFSEPWLCNIAHQYQQVTDWHLRQPTMESTS